MGSDYSDWYVAQLAVLADELLTLDEYGCSLHKCFSHGVCAAKGDFCICSSGHFLRDCSI